MLLARYAQIGSPRFEKLSKSVRKFDKITGWLSPQLFAIWTTFVLGMSVGKAQSDRYYFWDWSSWLVGLIGLVLITVILNIIKDRNDKLPFKNEIVSLKNKGYYAIMPLILMILGFVFTAGLDSAIVVLVYLFPYIAIYLIHTISIDEKTNIIIHDSKKYLKTVISILLLLIAVIIGAFNDDSLITTASVVSLPFLFVLLFGKHVRHLERARFYPIFIFAMFVSSREAWFLIPLFLLFHILRSYNYLRNQKVYPTFGVNSDNN